jgi:branched-chain amino acid aminotransferase
MELCDVHEIPLIEADLSLSEFINAEGVFATGTMGELTPIVEIDGREISRDSKLMDRVLKLFKNNVRSFCEPLI